MSLNGLEALEINEAYHTALIEGGCWFFLNYSARDEVALHGKGNGGVTEAQEAVSAFGEDSPLYGFIHFRRRKVILKYVPEGASRLLQARVAVHFQSIEDKFNPHDATFAFATPADLKETSLSSEIALHTAASIKSISESHLSGITEDDTDTRSEATQKPDLTVEWGSHDSSSKRDDDAQTRHEKATEIMSAMRGHERSSLTTQSLRPRTASDRNKALPSPPAKLVRDRSKPRSIYDSDARPSVSSGNDGRMSSQSARPSTRDLSSAYEYKPKVKLGPRPSTDSPGKPGSVGADGEFRPVATLPAGLRMPVRKTAPGPPIPEQKNAPFISTRPPDIPLPPNPPSRTINPITTPWPSVTSNGLPSVARMNDSKATKMTPEKKRLMKALQLRQQQMAKQKSAETTQALQNRDDEALHHVEQGSSTCQTSHDVRRLTSDSGRSIAKVGDTDQAGLEQNNYVASRQDPEEQTQDSPTSGPEPSDGPSTQASSVTEEDAPMQKLSHTSGETIRAGEGSRELQDPTQAFEDTIRRPRGKTDYVPFAETLKAQEQATADSQPTDARIMERTVAGDVDDIPEPEKEDLSTMEFGGDGQGLEPSSMVQQRMSDIYIDPRNPKTESIEQNVLDVLLAQGHDEPVQKSSDASQQTVRFSDDVGHFDAPAPEQNLSQQVTGSNSAESQPTGQLLGQASSALMPPEIANKYESDCKDDSHTPSVTLPMGTESVKVQDRPVDLRASLDISPQPPGEGLQVPNSDHESGQVPATAATEYGAGGHKSEDVSTDQYRILVDLETSSMPAEGSQRSEVHLGNTEFIMTKSSTKDTIKSPPTSFSIDDSQGAKRKKQSSIVSPLQRTSSPDQSDEHFLSDDSFMEELKTASVQQAKPVSVSKSPIRSVFAQHHSKHRSSEKPKVIRTVSSSVAETKKDEEGAFPSTIPASVARSFSASNSPFLNSPSTFVSQHKKIEVSSSISQRIKALEQLSSRPTSPTLQATPQTTFISLRERKSSLRSPPGTPDVNAIHVNLSPPGTSYLSPSASPDIARLGPAHRSGIQHPESVTVTATIVRSASDSFPEKSPNLSEPRSLDLHKSPLLVEHQTMGPPPLSPLLPPRPRYSRHASARSGSSSSTEVKKEVSSPKARRDSFASWRSSSSRNGSDLDLPRSASDRSLSIASGLDGIKEEKRDSKRSRMLKRMSSITTMSRRSIASALSPGPKEASIVEHQEPPAQAPSSAVDLDDVSIQFPDTLLWKRRHMLIDEHGVLVLSPSASDKNTKVLTKRFPLSEFRPPYIPDQDRQELANSVILDFKDGSTLQCACETPRGQTGIFNALRLAHSNYQTR